ncbi:heme-binding protein [Citrobacter amalonaticus]|uniref:Heme-binding protein n=1 Tax=Citrobacter amalonaticus TaxID=35703 RepID=A0A2S4RZS8_CITAM|nr:heme-binding protein [Citrobacter amalonaticus]POT58136.1 heme-binding protein [Citrobacter amalonaticus]POT76339.1 heme-binding protein [Citrobacter amalonaticus]POU66662.1 heme-binding protein [Citrobacter amalonaticus]POV05574.1 heme-binding protein [Citrobacter amalonaticus]
MTTLTLEQASRAVENALSLAATHYNQRPLSVAVCDASGELLSFARMDNARLLTIELTQRKARTSSRLGCTTQAFLQRLQKEQLDISYFADARFTALPGGIPIIHEGKCLGAVAVGGLSAQEDHDAAQTVAESLLKEIAQ